MKVGEIIHCESEEKLRELLMELGKAGFHAVRDSVYSKYDVRITGVPEETFLVRASDGEGGGKDIPCGSIKEAQEIAADLEGQYEYVEILKRIGGFWDVIYDYVRSEHYAH